MDISYNIALFLAGLAFAVSSVDSDHIINDVTFDNLVIAGKKRMSLEDGQISANSYAKNISFK